MSTTIAHSPATSSLSVHNPSPRAYTSIASAPPAMDPYQRRARSNGSPDQAGAVLAERGGSAAGKTSPENRSALPPMIKKEPGSPLPSARSRPKRLDLSTSNGRAPSAAMPSAPLTSRDSAGLAIQDVGLACLSPGFQTNDPGMREQVQRSLNVRDRQRMIIEARQKGLKPGGSYDVGEGGLRVQDNTLFGVQVQTPTASRRKGPPPGLSINAPSATQFANDRVIQSAPMHQTFTGLRPGEHPFSRHSQLGPSGLSQTSHIHHIPATQTNNRLPPIADVFANDRLEASTAYNSSPSHPSHSNLPPVPSPGFGPPPQHNPPMSARSKEFRSAEEAVHGLSGGRDELMPKVIHYGGVQPPTPPSPMPPGARIHPPATGVAHDPLHSHSSRDSVYRPDILNRTSSSSRRRGRDEYERDNGSPPSTFNRSDAKRATIAIRGDDRAEDDWRTNMSSAEKRDEFLRLCERAWDLFHS